MITAIFYLSVILLEFAFLACFTIYTLSLIYSSIKGSPYVPTKKRQVELILKEAKLKKGQLFVELGSGDGRAVIMAAKMYGVKSLGIEVNPVLTWYAGLKAKLAKVKNVTFITGNILQEDIKDADVVYVFLMPELIKKLESRLHTLSKSTLVISHGFRVPYLEKRKIKIIENKPFPTYFYRI